MLENLTKKKIVGKGKRKRSTNISGRALRKGKKENLSKKTHFKQGFSFGESEVSVVVHFEKTEVVVESSVYWFC